MLDANLTAQLTGLLKENLRENVELRARLDDGPTSARIRELLDELAALSDRISVAAGRRSPGPGFAGAG